MGMVSRKVMPVCESLCFFCPSLRARSRHPVKRYKQLLSGIFPRSQGDAPNDRKISKLCEYASKNPLRIPKITGYLEQRCYKELRSEQLLSVKVVLSIYRKLLITCKKQMSLFSASLLSIINILLDQTRYDELRVLGCQTLFEFICNQTDGSYMFNLDGLIPKLCFLAQELGEESRVQHLRSAGLQALSSMIWFMDEFSHIPTEFDSIVTVVLENYGGFGKNPDALTHEEHHGVEKDSPSQDVMSRISSWKRTVNEKGEVLVSMEDAKNPRFWSRVCLRNMAKLAKEATTVRPVFESLFRYFDNGDLWSHQHGLALPVLADMQLLIEKFVQNSHILLSILIKHLDHKNILKNPNMQLDILDVATSLARQTKIQPSVAITAAFSDMMRHLRKSIHCCLDDSNLGVEVMQWNRKYRAAVDDCLVQLSHKIGDAGPILDMMAVMLENISNITVMLRTLISAVYRTAQIVAFIPNLTYQNKAFPGALFHQLLQAMVCSDHESRIGAHSIFSVVLIPSSVCPRPSATTLSSTRAVNIQRTLSRNVSVFSSSAALFDKLTKEHFSSQENLPQEMEYKTIQDNNNSSMLNRLKSYSRAASTRKNPSAMTEDESNTSNLTHDKIYSLRLSSHQISLLLSSIWAQAISPLNKPENYEAIAHTYSLVLLFARSKNSSTETLIQSFQLALSLRSFSLSEGAPMQPSRRRSLFTLSTSMIIFSSKAFNMPALVLSVKTALTDKTVDPFLQLVGDSKLQAVKTGKDHPLKVYASKEDNEDALKSLSAIEMTENQTRESLAIMIVKFIARSSDQDSSDLKQQLLNDFMPDDGCPLGAQLFTENSYNYEPSAFTAENDDTPITFGNQIDNTDPYTQFSLETPNLLGVDELLDSLSKTTNQVGRLSVSTPTTMPYNEMAGNCEALIAEKQQKMFVFMSSQQNQDIISAPDNNNRQEEIAASPTHIDPVSSKDGNPFLDQNSGPVLQNQPVNNSVPMPCATEYQQQPHLFQLPPSSPYDHFLKAAGC